jgi:hypothetical protein
MGDLSRTCGNLSGELSSNMLNKYGLVATKKGGINQEELGY